MGKFSITRIIKHTNKLLTKPPTTIKGGYVTTNRRIDTNYSECAISSFYPESLLSLDGLKGKTVLDVGSGRGGFVKDLRERGIKAFSIDFNTAKPENIGTHSRADARNLPFKSSCFDVIYSTWSLFSYPEALDTQIKALKEMCRVLKQGGKIMFSPIKLSRIQSLIKTSGLPLKISNTGYTPLLKKKSPLFKKLALSTGKTDTAYSRYVEITKLK